MDPNASRSHPKIQEAGDEPYDDKRFMYASAEHRYLDDLVHKKILLERGINEDKLAEKLPNFHARLYSCGWNVSLPHPAKLMRCGFARFMPIFGVQTLMIRLS